MKYVSNRHRTALHNEHLPDGDLTPRQRAIADAVRGCHSLSDFVAAPAQVVTSVHVCTVQLDTNPAFAAHQIGYGIAKARAELDRLEAVYRCYGAEAFSPRPEPVFAPFGSSDDTRHSVVTRILRWCSNNGLILLRAGDKRVTRDPSGAYCVVEG